MGKDEKKATNPESQMESLLASGDQPELPRVGDTTQGTILSVSKNEVYLDINGVLMGVIRGRELFDESGNTSELKMGDTAEAIVLDLENEKGIMELSFRQAGHQKAWSDLEELMKTGDILDVPVTDANKGGLMTRVGRIEGFLPVSQLTVEHYPRVEGGDKNKILELLGKFVGETMRVKIIDINEVENKLIVSEKSAWEEEQKDVLNKYSVGDTIEGNVTGVVDFGAFVEFGEHLEGLVHISELAWQRIDDPREIIKVGDKVKTKIIGISGSKISLSMKALKEDPWKEAIKRYKIGQTVKGKVLKVNPFGLFVELDEDIHGLAHISELSSKHIASPTEVAKPNQDLDFKIISIEPEYHRLGLSLKALEKNDGNIDKNVNVTKEEPASDNSKESALPEKNQEKEPPASSLRSETSGSTGSKAEPEKSAKPAEKSEFETKKKDA